MNILITGGCGFLGSNLANHGIKNSYKVTIFDNLSRLGSSANLEWFNTLGDYKYIHGDIRNQMDVENIVKDGQFDVVFHLAGQVAMTTSITNPFNDFQINSLGTLNVLESVRKYSPHTAVLYSSTNKVYGDLEEFTYIETPSRYICAEHPNGFDENTRLDFRSPYGCSKGAADQYMLDYHRVFNLKTVVFRHSSMYGSRQFASYDQGWIGWFCKMAIDKAKTPQLRPFSISGNGKQVRDILHANDMIKLYYSAFDNIEKIKGHSFNIGGGMDQSLSLLELFKLLEEMLNIEMNYSMLPPRASDQKVFVADISKIHNMTGWKPEVNSNEGIYDMLEWVKKL